MRIMDDAKRVNLYGQYFEDMREDLNAAILEAMASMYRKDISESTVGLRINIEALRACTSDESAPNGVRERIIPDISYKVTLTLHTKSERKGNVVSPDHEITRDESGAFFILTKQEADGQIGIFDTLEE